jgi:arylsulfatase A-like enzyme
MIRLWVLTVFALIISGFSAHAQQSGSRPNIVLIIGDDMRYDTYGPTGAPAWFSSPSINRVAEEGANFVNYFCVYSLCIPSRSSIMTGLYPHNNGAYDNTAQYNSSLPTIATILDDAGYHTAMVGKFHVFYTPQPGWDYWFSKYGETDYSDPKFNYNGQSKTIPGHTATIINDSATAVLSTIDTPFLVNIGHMIAHKTIVPEPQYEGMYAQESMPMPSNFYKYQKDYPSFLYDRGFYLFEEQLEEDYEEYFEGLMSIEENLQDVFSILEARGILENTMIIFTSDNGSLYGEHLLAGKGVPYEPSIRQPLFIRYPAWFSPGTEVTASIGLHVDLASTICEAAGIDDQPYHFQGISLHDQATGEEIRNLMLFENIKLYPDEGDDDLPTPSIRSVRDFQYKYNRYQCSTQTEEFFDLMNDPQENTNLIRDTSYLPLIEQYRFKLDSLRMALGDTLAADTLTKDCFLKGAKKIRDVTLQHTGDSIIFHFRLFPNPVQDEDEILLLADAGGGSEILVFNNLGQLVLSRNLTLESGMNDSGIDAGQLPQGVYYVRVSCEGKWGTRLLVRNMQFE